MNQDTIAAISTGMTNSGIGIVRISGSEALEIADRVYKGKETITEVPPWQLISTVSSPVNVRGPRITITSTSSTVSSPSITCP